MNKEQKQDFTRRIVNSNRSGLIVVLFDMLYCYLQDACDAKEAPAADTPDFTESIRKADQVLKRLSDDLDFKYELSAELMRLYLFSRQQLAMALVRNSAKEVHDVEQVLTPVAEAFREVAAQDDSPVMMANAQQVYAGMTYGRGSLSENIDTGSTNRGYLA